MEQRGDQSWGVTDGEFIYKTKGSIIDTFIDCELNGPLYHTRMASCGSVSDRNAHPFRFEGKNIVTGVHNGTLTNFSALKEKYKERKDFEVDSEHIFAHLAEGKPVAEIGGSGAVVWYEQPADKSVLMRRYFSRFNTEAMHFAKLDTGEIVFASTRDAIIIAAQLASSTIEHFYVTEAKKRYWIEEDPERPGHQKLYHDIDLPWAESPVVWTAPTYTGNGLTGYPNRSRGGFHSTTQGDCPARNCPNGKLGKDEIICTNCFRALKKDIFGDHATV